MQIYEYMSYCVHIEHIRLSLRISSRPSRANARPHLGREGAALRLLAVGNLEVRGHGVGAPGRAAPSARSHEGWGGRGGGEGGGRGGGEGGEREPKSPEMRPS